MGDEIGLGINLHLPNIVSFFLLGAVNGLVTGGVMGMSNGVAPYAGGGSLIMASVAGIVGLFATSLVGMLFSDYTGKLQLVSKDQKTNKWTLGAGASVVLGGIFNGLFFWLLHSLSFFQYGGFFGNALAGGLALMGYSVIVQPLMSSLKKL